MKDTDIINSMNYINKQKQQSDKLISKMYINLQNIIRFSKDINRILSEEKNWLCYILYSINPSYLNHTYGGATNNMMRRIRQHNGEIVGGAKATSRIKPLRIICTIEGFLSKHMALSAEWLIHHPTRQRKKPKRFSGIVGRLNSLNYLIIQSDSWKSKFGNLKLKIRICTQYAMHLKINQFPPTVSVEEFIF